ncbi:16S rRNA (adenine(1518)-N(6)/adenine(1519)-N(6))-dimethyltransferase RsmA [Teredinibacter waterburyi]|jgi:dimethyladenosine transferase (EC 2.1.1.-)|uniref:16S rRNA (adenine(1518)-N(6)/adenine(1519)-N(6))- dimethyltransferase RsmA n=1 Tax=Teredinibacter waterburyi TaxID=1500538 RepID=UPI00165F2CAA|nr:16S rRNA (adenine(1518)-N(6)/adenine(1519)-N(6))-dimethyltransferase RsmA [Teredinibacter waterburyi]
MSKSPAPQQHRARKRFGQNFLVDQGIIRQIVRVIGPRADDNLVEIGPGKGAITSLLLDHCESLNVIELDRDLVPILLAQFAKFKDFKIHQTDALNFDFSSLVGEGKPLRVVGNLPYNISTPLIFHLLSFQDKIADMHFMLQKEVVLRLAAKAGEKNYGRLSIMAQYYCEVENLFEVPPESFQPAPKVDSAIVRLTPHKQKPYVADNLNHLETLVRAAFSQRRKTLRNSFKSLNLDEEIASLDVDLSKRAENLSLAEYVSISNALVAMAAEQ